MSVLASLGGGHLDNLAGTAYNHFMSLFPPLNLALLTLDDDVPVLAKGRALHGEGLRGPGAGLVDCITKNVSLAIPIEIWDAGQTCSKVCWCCSSSDMVAVVCGGVKGEVKVWCRKDERLRQTMS